MGSEWSRRQSNLRMGALELFEMVTNTRLFQSLREFARAELDSVLVPLADVDVEAMQPLERRFVRLHQVQGVVRQPPGPAILVQGTGMEVHGQPDS